MSKTLKFKTFCVESYKYSKGLSGKEVVGIFDKYNVLDYINEFYEPLHSVSMSYIVEDIDLYIKARQFA